MAEPSPTSTPAALEYASRVPEPAALGEPQTLRRYSVYGFDDLSQRSVRVRVDAYGLPNLYAQLRQAQIMAEFIADDPGSHDEAPAVEHWHADAGGHAPAEFAKQVCRMTSTGYGRYAPIPPIRVRPGEEHKTASPARGIILRLPDGYTIASGRFAQQGEAYGKIFVWGLVAGIIDVALGGVAVGAVMIVARGGPVFTIAIVAITLTMILPGIVFLVMASFARNARGIWLPITCLVIATLFCLLMAVSIFGQLLQPRPDMTAVVMTFGLLAIHAALVVQCVKALLDGPRADIRHA